MRIDLDGKMYEVSEKNIRLVLEKIVDRKIELDEVVGLMKKYHLYNKDFLENISIRVK